MLKRKIIAISIVLFGGLFFVWNIYSSSSAEPDYLLGASLVGDKTSPGFNFKNTPISLENGTQKNSTFNNIDDGNLTNQMIGEYLQIVASKNDNRPVEEKTGDTIILPSLNINTLLNDLLKKKSISEILSFNEFKAADVRTLNDNSDTAIINYIESVDASLRKNFIGFDKDIGTAIDAFLTNQDSKYLNQLLTMIPGHIKTLLEIKPPSTFLTTHLEMLNLWQEKLAIYNGIINMETDVMKAILCLQDIKSIIQKDLSLQKILIEKYNDLTKKP